MDEYLLIVRSVTHAQHTVQALWTCGVRGTMLRAPAGLTDRGCSYGVRIRAADRDTAKTCLQRAGLIPLEVYSREEGGYRRVIW